MSRAAQGGGTGTGTVATGSTRHPPRESSPRPGRLPVRPRQGPLVRHTGWCDIHEFRAHGALRLAPRPPRGRVRVHPVPLRTPVRVPRATGHRPVGHCGPRSAGPRPAPRSSGGRPPESAARPRVHRVEGGLPPPHIRPGGPGFRSARLLPEGPGRLGGPHGRGRLRARRLRRGCDGHRLRLGRGAARAPAGAQFRGSGGARRGDRQARALRLPHALLLGEHGERRRQAGARPGASASSPPSSPAPTSRGRGWAGRSSCAFGRWRPPRGI